MEDVVCLFDFYDVRSFVDSKAQEAFYNVWGSKCASTNSPPFIIQLTPSLNGIKSPFSMENTGLVQQNNI